MASLHHLLLLIFLTPFAFAARGLAGGDHGKVNPLTPKATVLRYWSQKVPDGQPMPEFLVSKLSPLTVQNMTELQRLAYGNALSTKLEAFCSWANLSCPPDVTAGQEKHAGPLLIRQVTDPSKNFYNGREKDHPDPYYYSGREKNHQDPYYDGGREKNHPDPYYYGGREKNHPDPYYYGGQENRLNDNAGPHSGHSLSMAWEHMFFRESQLQEGEMVKMPDMKDKMTVRSFLPRSIAGKLPFTSSGLPELLQVFKAGENSDFGYTMGKTVWECERAPSKGETKRCVTSVEDMIDFAVDVVGPAATAKTTAGLGGNNATVQIGKVDKMKEGRVTESVSCHQKPFPYLVYSCHSIRNVRMYEVELLDQSTKAPLNRAIAICHFDTSGWSPDHISFRRLGLGPGKTEVCHWIFQNDFAWVPAN